VPAYPAWSDGANGRPIRECLGNTGPDAKPPSADQPGAIAPAEWLAAIGRRWRGGHMPHLARLLAEIADPATGTIELDPVTLRQLLNQLRLLLVGLKRLLDMLVAHGFLTPTPAGPGQKLGSYRLAMRGSGRG
jgi:hypothetical protein